MVEIGCKLAAMLHRATLWILTAAIAVCAGTGVPVSRLQMVQVDVCIVWQDQYQQEQAVHTARRKTWSSNVDIPEKRGDCPFVNRIHVHALDNRPPPASSLS
jgi:hypothetical protein